MPSPFHIDFATVSFVPHHKIGDDTAKPKDPQALKRQQFSEFEAELTLLLMELISDGPSEVYSQFSFNIVSDALENVRFNYQRNRTLSRSYQIFYKSNRLCVVSLLPKRLITINPRPDQAIGFGSWDYAAKVLQKICHHRFSEMRVIHE